MKDVLDERCGREEGSLVERLLFTPRINLVRLSLARFERRDGHLGPERIVRSGVFHAQIPRIHAAVAGVPLRGTRVSGAVTMAQPSPGGRLVVDGL